VKGQEAAESRAEQSGGHWLDAVALQNAPDAAALMACHALETFGATSEEDRGFIVR
jgi:hypothetical protein